MRQFAAHTISGILLATSLIGCKFGATGSDVKPVEPLQQPVIDTAELSKEVTEKLNSDQAGINTTPQQCFLDICGETVVKVPNILLQIKNASTPTAEQETYFKQYIEPAMLKTSQTILRRNQTLLKVLEEKETRFANTKLNQAQMRFTALAISVNRLDEFPEVKTYLNQDYQKLDFTLANNTFKSMGNYSYFQTLYPKQNLVESYIQELEKLNTLTPRLNKDLGIFVESLPQTTIAKIKASQALSFQEVENFSKLSNTVRLVAHFLYEGGTSLVDKLVSEKLNSNEVLLSYYYKSPLKENLRSKSQSLQTIPQECKTQFYQAINLYPQASEVEKFKDLAETTRKAALSQLNTQDPAYKRIQELKFSLPSTASENTNAYLVSLGIDNKDVLEDIERFNTMSDAAAMTYAISNITDSNSTLKCTNAPNYEVSDKTLPEDGFIRISWYSVRNPEVGASILAHEIGHTVFRFSNSIEVARQCLAEKQNNSQQYLNEDFADIFAAKTQLALADQFNIKQYNIGCALTLTANDLVMTNPDTTDPHSAGLYRAIQFALHTGQKIPVSCQSLQQGAQQNLTKTCQ